MQDFDAKRDSLDRLQRLESMRAVVPATERAPHQPNQRPERIGEDDRRARDASRSVQPFGPEGAKPGDVRPGVAVQRDTAAALSALAGARPEALHRALLDHQDGTFTIRFLEQAFDGSRQPHAETVDGYLPANALQIERGETGVWQRLWPAIVEKAFAAWKGSYEATGHGGCSGDVMAALTGESVRQIATATSAPLLWRALQEASTAACAVTCSHGGDDEPDKPGRRRFVVHVVVGVREEGAEQRVQVRDPLAGDADRQPPVHDLTLAEFRARYDSVAILAGRNP